MDFRVLGVLEVRGADGRLCVLEPRQARVLAVLLLSANRIVTRWQLINAVWDDQPPATAERQLRNIVSALRHRLAGAGAPGPVIVADGPGYRIRVDEAELDAQVFGGHLTRAQVMLSSGQPADATRELRAALALWRGPALAGCTGRAIEAGAARLDEQRLTILEQCLDLELQLGRHHDLVGELTELVATNPLRESLVGQLMLALHRCGRQAEALGVYQRLRARLADDLGIDPGPALRDLHTAILRNQAGAPRAAATAGATVVPRQLPAPVRHFVGRDAELKDLTRLVDEAARGGGPVVISAIAGTGGIGKTALALYWAHQVVDEFPDGQLYLNLRGFDPSGSPMTPAEAIRNLLDAFQLPAERIPVSVDAQAGLYRSLIAGRRMLVLLDNARDADQVRPLLPGTPGCVVLITSRNQLTGLVAAQGARPIALGLLTPDEARDLLIRHIGRERLAAEPAAADVLIARCARLPLALTIVAARAVMHPTFPLASLAAELADTHRRLDALDTGEPATQVRAVFSWSYQLLKPEAARLFRLLGLHPGPDISAPAAASLAGVGPTDTRAALAELTRAHLVSEHVPGRYAFHDLLRAHAIEMAALHDTDDERHGAVRRMADHYLVTARTADILLGSRANRITVTEPDPHVVPEHPTDCDEAMAWLDTERPVLLGMVDQAAGAGFDIQAWQLAFSVHAILVRRGHLRDNELAHRTALAATRRIGDRRAEAMIAQNLGYTAAKLGRHDDAHAQLGQALALSQEIGDQGCQADIHGVIGVVCEMSGRLKEALAHAEQGLALRRAIGERRDQARSLNAVGWTHALLGNPGQALVHCEEALIVQRELGDRHGQAGTLDSLGYAHHQLGHHRQAIDHYQAAIELFREFGSRYFEANSLTHLGDTHRAAGDPNAARDAWRTALDILTQLDHPEAKPVADRLANLDHRTQPTGHDR